MEQPTPDILLNLMEASREQSSRRKKVNSKTVYEASFEREPHQGCAFLDAFEGPGFRLIAEYKRCSPSEGEIRPDRGVIQTIADYDWGGATAMSVLVEESRFGGSVDHLKLARKITKQPLLWKGFVSSAYEILEANEAEADAVLLIAAAYDDLKLAELQGFTQHQGMTPLIEVHDRNDLERALQLGPRIIGVNNRDLRTMEVDTDTTAELLELDLIPPETIVITESGIEVDDNNFDQSVELLRNLHARGVKGALIGTSLMRSADPEAVLRRLSAAVNA